MVQLGFFKNIHVALNINRMCGILDHSVHIFIYSIFSFCFWKETTFLWHVVYLRQSSLQEFLHIRSLFSLFFSCFSLALLPPPSYRLCRLKFPTSCFLGNFFTMRNPTKAENYRIMMKIKENKKKRRQTKRSLPQGKVLSPCCDYLRASELENRKG